MMVRSRKATLGGLLAWFLLFCLCLPLSTAGAQASNLSIEVIQSRDRYPAGGAYPIAFRVRVADPFYIHSSKDAGEGVIPTALSFSSSHGVSIEDVRFPPPQETKFPYTSKPVEVYSGDFSILASVKVSRDAGPGARLLEGALSYQACTPQACMPPEKTAVRIEASIVPQGAPSAALNQTFFDANDSSASGVLHAEGKPSLEAGFWLALLGIFLGGLALNLTPCIYPLIPITVSYFGGRSGEKCGPNCLHGLLYILGLAITNSALGLTAALSGGMLGAALQNPLVLIGVAAILFLLGLSFFGVWELRMPARLTRFASRQVSGYYGTFFMGLTIGIVAAPCLGPFILGLLTYVGQKGDPFLGFVYFFVLSLGLGLPLALLAVFSGALEKLPLSGVWMVWIRKALGWVLVGMAAYMVLPLAPGDAGKSILAAAVLAAAGLHLGWFERSGGKTSRAFYYVKKTMGSFLVVGALFFFFTGNQSHQGIVWRPYEPGAVEQASGQDRPVMLDFYADWCTPCRELEKQVFTDPDVVRLSRRFAAFRADLTSGTPHQEALLKRYNVRGVPTIVFLNRNGEELKSLRIESFVERPVLLKKMKEALTTPAPGQNPAQSG